MAEAKRAVPLLATRDLVLFPGMLAPIFVERDKGVRALEQTAQTGGMLVMAAQKSAATDEPEPEDIHTVGTLAKVVQFSRLSDGTLKALIEGRERVTIDSYQATQPLFTVRYGSSPTTWVRPPNSPRKRRPPWRRSPTRRAW
jgi:ATP-dependent Lon protease